MDIVRNNIVHIDSFVIVWDTQSIEVVAMNLRMVVQKIWDLFMSLGSNMVMKMNWILIVDKNSYLFLGHKVYEFYRSWKLF